MPLTDEIEATGKVLKGFVALISFFPGILYLTGIVDLPPALVKKVTIIAFSVSLVVLTSIFQDSVSAVILGGMLVVAYSEFAQRFVAHPPSAASFVVPVTPASNLLNSMATEQSHSRRLRAGRYLRP